MQTLSAFQHEPSTASMFRPARNTVTDLSQGRPSEQLAHLRREIADLEAYCATLKGALAAAGVASTPMRHPLLAKLKPQEAALVGILFAAYPRIMHRYDILEALPGRDTAEERVASLVPCKVAHVRKVLGHDAIENLRGEGYRLSPALYAQLSANNEDDADLQTAA